MTEKHGLCCQQSRPTGKGFYGLRRGVRPCRANPTWPEACSIALLVPRVPLHPARVGIAAARPCNWWDKRTRVPYVLQVHGQLHVAAQCQIDLFVDCIIFPKKKVHKTTKNHTRLSLTHAKHHGIILYLICSYAKKYMTYSL